MRTTITIDDDVSLGRCKLDSIDDVARVLAIAEGEAHP